MMRVRQAKRESRSMRFSVINRAQNVHSGGARRCLLEVDNWDDYHYQTMFNVYLFDDSGQRHDLGSVKIILEGMGHGRVRLPHEFEALDDSFCSLGQSRNYYETLEGLPHGLAEEFLVGLRDCVQDPSIWTRFKQDNAMQVSALRFVSISDVESEFPRALRGEATLTPYDFEYQPNESFPPMSFKVQAGSLPPTNIHALIGRNGVGKTHILVGMAQALTGSGAVIGGIDAGRFEFIDPSAPSANPFLRQDLSTRITSVVVVSFSIFDQFDHRVRTDVSTDKVGYRYIGSRVDVAAASAEGAASAGSVKTFATLREEFMTALRRCHEGKRRQRWQAALETLSSDPVFADLDVATWGESAISNDQQAEAVKSNFDSLSSGHKMVLLCMAQLVEAVNERSLVLIDEPETHLHPPLLSSFVRATSNLLRQRNGVAVLATHSPVVLQEVPRSCVWVINRAGSSFSAERPSVETFAENVGVLTREVFGLEVTESGHHKLLMSELKDSSPNSVVAKFSSQIGGEGRAILRALQSQRPD